MNGGQPSEELRQDDLENVIADAIRRAVAKAPPLRPEQRERLAGLLFTAGRANMTAHREPA